MESSTQEKESIQAIHAFLLLTKHIDLESEQITPATREAIGVMKSTGRELLEYYNINPVL